MKHLKLSLFSVVSLAGAVALTGCSGSFGFPDAGVNTPTAATSSPGSISGSNFGGHAPIVGAKVFMLQVGTSGYGSQATSLITAGNGTADTTIVGGTTTNPTAYYVTTDAAGGFNIPSNGYTCTAGYPVYLYAYGGAPDTNPSVGPSYITAATGNGTTTTFTVGNEKFYVGQQVTFQGIPTGNPWVGLDGGGGPNGTDQPGTPQTVTGIGTSGNTTFTIASTVNGSSSAFGNNSIVVPVGVQNPGIVNLAVLGICPPSTLSFSASLVSGQTQVLQATPSIASRLQIGQTITGTGLPAGTTILFANGTNGQIVVSNTDSATAGTSYTYTVQGTNNFENTSFDPISYVYMNEVSTAAAAFAMAPFAETNTIGANGVVTRTGTDAQHFGIPASNTLALTGIVNAATNAGQLYDITGVTNTVTSTDGESHVARTVVPNSGTGQGVATVPQALINTLGNILASCVDSNNTYGLGATGGTASSACTTLFETATSNGVPVTTLGATTPKDTATAAINIAHYPAGNGQGTNGGSTNPFTSALIGLQGTIFPFTPALPTTTTPNDFVIGINITVPQGSNPTNYLGSSGTSPVNAIPTSIAAASTGEVFVGTNGCGTGTESSTNGFGCVLQLEPTQLLPALPTVGGVGLAQGVKAVALGPSGKVWATGTVETGQTVGGYTPPGGGFYIVINTPSATNPITYGTANGSLATSYNFAAYGNTLVGSTSGAYTTMFGTPTSIALDGNAHAWIGDSSKNYLHYITGVTSSGVSYTSTNLDSAYLIQGSGGTGTNCVQNVTAVAIGSGTSTGNGSYKTGGAYNVWATSAATGALQGMCTFASPATGGLNAAVGTTPPVNTLTPIEQTGPQNTPISMAVDATDVGWDAQQSPAASFNQTGEGFPNNGLSQYGVFYGFARSGASEPEGVAIDGNNNQWYTNTASNSVSAYTSPGYVTFINDNPTAISPAGTAAGANNGGYTAGGTLSGPSSIAIDPSGDVWVGNTLTSAAGGTSVGYSVTELIGVAAPTYVPLSAATAAGKLGAKP